MSKLWLAALFSCPDDPSWSIDLKSKHKVPNQNLPGAYPSRPMPPNHDGLRLPARLPSWHHRWTFSIVLQLCAIGFSNQSVVAADSWQHIDGGRYREIAQIREGRTGFIRLPETQTGVQFTNVLPQDKYLTNTIYLNGSGVALGDVDGDGWCDIFLGAIGGRSALFRNLGGLKFEDIADKAGVRAARLGGHWAVLGDIDGDGSKKEKKSR